MSQRHGSLKVQGGLWEHPLSNVAGAQAPRGGVQEGDMHVMLITRSHNRRSEIWSGHSLNNQRP